MWSYPPSPAGLRDGLEGEHSRRGRRAVRPPSRSCVCSESRTRPWPKEWPKRTQHHAAALPSQSRLERVRSYNPLPAWTALAGPATSRQARKPAEPGAPTARGLTGWRGPGPLVAIVVANRSRLSRKRSRKCVLSLEILISLAYRKKRRQVGSLGWQSGRDNLLLYFNNPPTNMRGDGRAFFLPSSSSTYRLLHATIFPSAEIAHQTSCARCRECAWSAMR